MRADSGVTFSAMCWNIRHNADFHSGTVPLPGQGPCQAGLQCARSWDKGRHTGSLYGRCRCCQQVNEAVKLTPAPSKGECASAVNAVLQGLHDSETACFEREFSASWWCSQASSGDVVEFPYLLPEGSAGHPDHTLLPTFYMAATTQANCLKRCRGPPWENSSESR